MIVFFFFALSSSKHSTVRHFVKSKRAFLLQPKQHIKILSTVCHHFVLFFLLLSCVSLFKQEDKLTIYKHSISVPHRHFSWNGCISYFNNFQQLNILCWAIESSYLQSSHTSPMYTRLLPLLKSFMPQVLLQSSMLIINGPDYSAECNNFCNDHDLINSEAHYIQNKVCIHQSIGTPFALEIFYATSQDASYSKAPMKMHTADT